MNTASPISAELTTSVQNVKQQTTPNNKSPSATKLTASNPTTGGGGSASSSSSGSQFKISFSEIVRSSNTTVPAASSSNNANATPNIKSNLNQAAVATSTMITTSSTNKAAIPQLMATTALPLSSLQTHKPLNKAGESSSVTHQSLANSVNKTNVSSNSNSKN